MQRMKNIRKIPVLLLLSACICLTGCSKSSSAQSTDVSEKVKFTSYDDTSAIVNPTQYKASAEEQQALGSMTLELSNDQADLYMGARHDIAVVDKTTGSIFFSNPAIYDSSASSIGDEAKKIAYSQVGIDFFDDAEDETQLYSYPDVQNDEGKDQAKIQLSGDTLTVTYDFGIKGLVYCPVISGAAWKALDAKAQTLISDNKLDYVAYARFQGEYMELDYDNLSADDQKKYAGKYPTLKAHQQLYVLQDDLSDTQKDIYSTVGPLLGIDEKFTTEQEQLAKVKPKSSQKDSMFFEIPVQYKLDGRDLIAGIDLSKIQKSKSYYLTKIWLLGAFGASKNTQDGYMFIPDGSGAVINNNVTGVYPNTLDINFYGNDFAKDVEYANDIDTYSSLPVFGIKAGNKAVFGIVEQGDALGGVTAETSNADIGSVYNTLSPWTGYNAQDIASGDVADNNVLHNYAKRTPKTSFSVRYHFLYGAQSTYSGMAQYYQKYLVQNKLLSKQEIKNNLYVNFDFMGAVQTQKFVAGLPRNVLEALSNYSDIQKVMEQFYKSGLSNNHIVLRDAINGGADYKIPTKVKLEKVLGDQSQLNGLIALANKNGNAVDIAVDFTNVYKSGNGIKSNVQISNYINKQFAYVSDFFPSNDTQDLSDYPYIISPRAYSEIVGKFVNAYQVNNNKCISAESIASFLSSNFSEKYGLSREESKILTEKALQTLVEKGFKITVDGGNEYALKYATAVNDIPVDYNSYSLENYAVPFVGMVLHGYINYTGPQLNQQGNYQKAILQTVESGAGLNYVLMTEDAKRIQDTKYTNYYSLSTSQWTQKIISQYQSLNKDLASTVNATITANEMVQNNVARTDYSNGVSVYVNYNDDPVTVNGVKIEGLNYKVVTK